MARFYGWSWHDIDRMPLDQFVSYSIAIDPLIAAEKLEEINVSTFPHLKSSDRKNILSYLRRRSRKLLKSGNDKVATYESVLQNLREKINGVR